MKSFTRNHWLLILAISLGHFGPCAHAQQPAPATVPRSPAPDLTLRQLTNFWFQSMTLRESSLVCTFRSLGQRFFYSVNGGERKLSHYGEDVSVPLGGTMKLTHHHGTIVFSALPEPVKSHGFALEVTDDLRSFGQGILKREVYLVAVPAQGGKGAAAGAWEFRCVPPRIEAVRALLDASSSRRPPPASAAPNYEATNVNPPLKR